MHGHYGIFIHGCPRQSDRLAPLTGVASSEFVGVRSYRSKDSVLVALLLGIVYFSEH